MVQSLGSQPQDQTWKDIPTIAFIGITGAGKTTLMNAMAQQELGTQAGAGQVES